MNKHHTKQYWRDVRNGYIFILPFIIGFVVFTLGPMLFSLFASFNYYDITANMKWVAWDNYKNIFLNDEFFRISLLNTLYYAVFSIPVGIIASLSLALMLNVDVPGSKIFRSIYYLPSVLSGVAVMLLWMWIFNPQVGILNTLLGYVGIQGPDWLSNPKWSKPALVVMKLWGVGGTMLLFLAALKNVPKELYEAAQIDGAGILTQFRHITLPLISPTMFFVLITGINGAFQIFDQAYVMTKGGPANSTLFYVLYLFNKGFKEFKMGYASALAWILFVIIMIITIIQFKVSKKWVYYEGEVR